MSTEQVDPELVEQTKQQIRNLVREIAQLSKSELGPVEYYDALLNRLVSALAAVGGAVWTTNEAGRLELQYQINLRETRLAESPDAQAVHGRLLRKVMTSSEGMLVAPQSGAGNEEDGGNPTDFLLVLGPLKTDQDTLGIIEVFQRPGSSPTVQRGYLRFLLQMCELAGDYLKTRKLRNFTDRQSLWSQLENFTRIAHRSLDPRTTAFTIANEGRRLIECDRVSVAINRGRKCVIEAVSGQDTLDKRSNTITLLNRLATAVVATGEPVWYTGDTSDMAPQVEEAVQAYADDSHSKTVAIIPLKRPRDLTEDKDKLEPEEVIGALIVEQIEDARPREGLPQRIEVVSEHSSTALANALQHHDLFLLPVWEMLGKTKWAFRARTLPKTISIGVASLVALLVLTFWPKDFNLEGKGALQPAVRREVFAGINGVVIEVPVRHGEMVAKGQLLARMRNTDLEVSIAKTAGDREASQKQILAIRRTLNDSKDLKIQELNRLSGQLLELERTYESLGDQLKLLFEKQEQLKVVSPIAGQLVTWQVRELLIHRPVQQGQILMSVADPAGEWELEIHMPENRMGHVAKARREWSEERKTNPEMARDLPVTYILATSPGARHVGNIKEVHSNAEVRNTEEGNTVLVRVAIDKNELTDLRPGASVISKIHCGRRSLGYVLFHDVIAFLQTKVFFRI